METNEKIETEMANDLRSFLNPNETASQRQARLYGAKVEAYGGEVEATSKLLAPMPPSVLPTEPPPAPIGESVLPLSRQNSRASYRSNNSGIGSQLLGLEKGVVRLATYVSDSVRTCAF